MFGALAISGEASLFILPDGIGNGCQCGNLGFVANPDDGQVTSDDLAKLQEALLDPVSNPDAIALCSVDPDVMPCDGTFEECNAKDALTLQLALESPGTATLEQVCERQRPPLRIRRRLGLPN